MFLVFNVFSENPENLPLSKCWQLNYTDFNSNLSASDNDQIFTISQNTLIKISESGTVFWQTPLPKENFLKLFLVGDKILLFNFLDEKKVYILRAFSKNSGLLIQSKEFNLPELLDPTFFQLTEQSNLLIANRKSLHSINLNTFESSNNQINEKEQIIAINNSQVFSLNENNEITLTSLLNGTNNSFFSNQLRAESINSIFFVKNDSDLVGKLFITDDLGSIYSINTQINRIDWTLKFGAKIRQNTFFNSFIYISAQDNYIYKISLSGKKHWKIKLFSRNEFQIDESGKFLFTVNLGERYAEFIDLEKGKIINQIELEGENYFTERPYKIGKTFIFITKNGILGYSFGKCEKAG